MPRLFDEIRERLLLAGVAPRHVRRYLSELGEHLDDLRAEEVRAGRSREDAESAALARLGGVEELSRAMIERREFQAWCARAPWATFGLAPLLVLAGAYLAACLILWSGWRIFLPGADSPFVRIDGLTIVYFGIGRDLYSYSPVLIGWGLALVAIRQRVRAVWPAVGMAVMALIAGTAQVHAGHPVAAGEAGRISMGLTLGSSIQDALHCLLRALAVFAVAALPMVVWRLRRARPQSS
jgi:hypothetical protein